MFRPLQAISRPMKRFIFAIAAAVSGNAFAVSGLDLDFELVTSSIPSPVAIANAGDDRLFVVSSVGEIRIVEADGTLLSTPFLDIKSKVRSGGERGLLGLAFHPDYANNGYFYVNYTRDGDGDTVIARFSVSAGDRNVATSASESRLLTVNQVSDVHKAGALAFDPGPENYLYIPLGDGGNGSNARNTGNLLGTVIRIDVDGGTGTAPDCVGEGVGGYTVPTSNPLSDGAGGDCDEVWAYGLRNPFRSSFDQDTGDFYIGDVGEQSFEEVNFQPAGLAEVDWGWNCREGLSSYPPGGCSAPSRRDPFFDYGRTDGRSVIGGFVYRGSLYPGLDGIYFFNDYYEETVWAARRNASDVWVVTKYANTLPDVFFSSWGEDSDGELYVVSRSFSGTGDLYRLVDNSTPNDPPVITEGTSTSVDMDEDSSPVMFSLTLNATDDGAAGDLDWSISSNPGNGSATAPGSGSSTVVTYTPDSNYNGADSFEVTVTDGFGASDSIDVSVNVRPRNDAPNNTQAPSISGTPTVGTTLTANSGSWNDSTDLAPGTLSFSYQWETSADDQTFSNIAGATAATYELLAQDENQFVRVMVTASDDGEGLPVSQSTLVASASVEVFAPNDPPVITEGATVSVDMDEDEAPVSFSLTLNATDDGPAGDLSWSVSSNPGNGTASATGSGLSVPVTYTPASNFNGADSFVVTIMDGFGESDSIDVSVNIRPRNDAPNNTQAPTISGTPTTGETLTASNGSWNDNTDLAPGNLSFTYQWERSADDVNFAGIAGAVAATYELQEQDENQFVRVTITATDDGEGLPTSQASAAASASVEVFEPNDPPVITEGTEASVDMDEDGSPGGFSLTLNATDNGPAGDLSWQVESAPGNGIASATGSGASVNVTYSPNADYNGSDSFEVAVRDAFGATDTITVNVTIRPRNDAPNNTQPPTIIGVGTVDSTLSADPGAWNDATDLTPGNISFSYQWQRSADDQSFSDIAGEISSDYVIQAQDEGQFLRLEVTATDDGEGLPASQQVVLNTASLEIFLDNPPPRILEGPAINILMDEDSTPTAFTLNLRASDDGPVEELVWDVSSAPSSGEASVPAGGTPVAVSYSPTPDFNGTDSFEITLMDGSGQSDTIRIGIIVQPRNDPPQNTVPPSVAGSPGVGQTLTADPGTWTDAADLAPGELQFSYQWQASVDGSSYGDIADAIESEYVLSILDEGQFIRVRVTATDDGEGLPAAQSASAVSTPVTVPLETILITGFELEP